MPPLRVLVTVGLVVLALVAAGRWVSGRTDEASDAVSGSITTPIDRAARAEAVASVAAGMRAAQLYVAEHGTYAGISAAALRTIDAGLPPNVQVYQAAGGYCLDATVRGVSVRNAGPSAGIVDGTCA